jgi:acyl-coenzyme A synthetase/AMP-(fatty) acid ligase
MGKSSEYLITVLGIWRLGAVHVPLFTAFAPPAIVLRLSGCGATAVVCDGAQRAKLDPGEGIRTRQCRKPPVLLICLLRPPLGGEDLSHLW